MEKMARKTKSGKTKKEGVMKKLIVAGLVVMLTVFAGSAAQAVMETTKTVNIGVNVTGVFGFDIWDTEYAQTQEVAPGGAGMGDVHIGASSNHTIPWMITASSVGLIGKVFGEVLPIKMTTFGGSLTGTKVKDLVLTGSATAIYTAGTGEYPKGGVAVNSIWVVPISDGYLSPATTQDLYEGIIVLTMTE